MQHRHLDTTGFSTAAIASILERGGASDLRTLFRALRDDPYGPAAEAALRAAEASDVYGYPELIRACLEAWRSRQPTTSVGND
ncbi:MAG TPA: hypothetical protein VFA81_03220 [Burkholderiales bacterium]|nr:hypothetical protein [Burkholderiales bacterium]